LLAPPASRDALEVARRGPALRPWASKRILRAWHRMSKHGRRVGPATPDVKLHQVRLDAKELRYLLQFFRSLYPARRIDPLVKELSRFQDGLGAFNDSHVQGETLRGLAPALIALDAPGETMLALGRLIERAEQRGSRHRADFQARFRRFDDADNRRRFEKLFGAGKKATKKAGKRSRERERRKRKPKQ